jgi:epoxyqueuosine reductase
MHQQRDGGQLAVTPHDADLVPRLQAWAHELGFSQIGVTGVDLSEVEPGLQAWLEAGFHGTMHYMALHGMKRARPRELRPGTLSVITARMDYLPKDHGPEWRDAETQRLSRPGEAVVSLYARGRDYHKVLRSRLQQLADRLADVVGPLGHRVFTDSAPVLEVELAARSGLGWRGKHTLALSRDAGSMFFLGEIFVDLALPTTPASEPHCGQCRACIDVCPTQAIVAPFRLDARRCISYLTIEHDGPIPVEFRRAMGQRIYGCDDCQVVCPWNKYARRALLPDFDARPEFRDPTLLDLWAWSEEEFLRRTEGSAIRRIGWTRWRRNLAVGLGNALAQAEAAGDAGGAKALREALAAAAPASDELVRSHIDWALSSATAPGTLNPQAGAPAPASSSDPPFASLAP